jgi:hypothetical protein
MKIDEGTMLLKELESGLGLTRIKNSLTRYYFRHTISRSATHPILELEQLAIPVGS